MIKKKKKQSKKKHNRTINSIFLVSYVASYQNWLVIDFASMNISDSDGVHCYYFLSFVITGEIFSFECSVKIKYKIPLT
ncbi:hypothetical protein HanRHA438_Chr11g0525931 [Helianthus annuus]|nr:hypothetical protein HanRHA438_Chr11g0525931 [Helianthus annuus]